MKNGGAATDHGCRLQMPRPIQLETELACIDGVDILLIKRLARDLVPFWDVIMLAMPTNMAMYITAEQSRYARELEMWSALAPEIQAKVPKPQPLSTLEAVYIGCLYACKYSTKIEQMSMAENPLRAIQVGILATHTVFAWTGFQVMDNAGENDSIQHVLRPDNRRELRIHILAMHLQVTS